MALLDKLASGDDAIVAYHRTVMYRKLFPIVATVLAIITLILSFSVGKYNIDFLECYRLLHNRIFGSPIHTTAEEIIWDMRVPRGLMALVAGACLAVGGAVMQSMLHNPLADPYTTGVSSGASLGATIAIVLGISILPIGGNVSIVANAFAMSLIPAGFIVFLSAVKKVTSTMMILVGIGVMYIFSAITQILKLIATPNQMQQIYMWQLGSAEFASFDQILLVFVVTIVCITLLYCFRHDLNRLSVGDNAAVTMGTNPWRIRIICLVIVSLMTATCVSFTGTIGFVGLVVPQIIRVLIGSDNRYLIPASAAFGAFFLVIADSIARVVGTTGLPVGVITAVIGSPLFLYMLVKNSRRRV